MFFVLVPKVLGLHFKVHYYSYSYTEQGLPGVLKTVSFILTTAFYFCRRHIVSQSACALLPVHKAVSVLRVLPGCSWPHTLGVVPQISALTAHWSVLPLLFDPTASASSLSSLLRTRLLLVQYHLQFGAGVFFRHIVRNAAGLSCCGTGILFAMLHSLAHKMLSCRFSYRKCWDGHYRGNVSSHSKTLFLCS